MNATLLRKYNVQGPRYTSYPTVPYWESPYDFNASWPQLARAAFEQSNATEGISLYIHLPYCESLCTYCGCNKRITVNHAVEGPYIDALLKEWDLYVALLGAPPRIRELHLGGGTPTFFSPANLERLVNGLLNKASLAPSHELGFEGHPNNTSRAHLQMLYDLGFRRLSLGIQDFDPQVQEIINRVQPYSAVKACTEAAREIGYTSINFDLIYGLPLQKRNSVIQTLRKVEKLSPDRIAFYSYAHVPWISPAQRSYTEADLPLREEKLQLYQIGLEMLRGMGFHAIGMDHFAKPTDALYQAVRAGRMHRNFMGYTPHKTELMIGLGASSISDSWTAFAQNHKTVESYLDAVNRGELPVFRGHVLNDEDLFLRRHILNLMCNYRSKWTPAEVPFPSFFEGLERLAEMESEGLVKHTPGRLTVTSKGKPFVRNVCMALDARLARKQPAKQIFSKTI